METSSSDSNQNPESLIHVDEGASNHYGDVTFSNGSAHFGNNITSVYVVAGTSTTYETNRLQELKNSLPALRFDIKQETVNDQCMVGSGQWFLDSTKFTQWIAGSEQTLWCPGIPGAGKTSMASIVTKYLKHFCAAKQGYAHTCVYFEYDNRDKHNPSAIYGSLLAQILAKQKKMSQALFSKYKDLARDRLTLEGKHYLALLSIAVKSYTKIFVVVDALDECMEKDRALFVTALQSIGSQVNILITSRPIGTIARLFENQPSQEIYAAEVDLDAYIRDQIVNYVELSQMISDDSELEEEIVLALVQRAQKMFLLVRLHVQFLSSCLTIDDVRNALEILPRELDETYDKALCRIAEQNGPTKNLGFEVLTWLMVSMRPMSLAELHHALSVKSEHRKFAKGSLIHNINKIASACAGLVTIDPSRKDEPTNTVRLVHYTTQEYLAKHMNRLCAQPNAMIASACLTYLNFEDLDQDLSREHILKCLPFAAYAARYWGWHLARVTEPGSELEARAMKLLRKDERATDCFILEPTSHEAADDDRLRHWIARSRPKAPHIAAHFGLSSIFQFFIDHGETLNCRDGTGNTPLHYAAWTGQDSILQIYQANAADLMVLNEQNPRSMPLQCAAVNGQVGFAASLVLAGADVNYNREGQEFAEPAIHEGIRHNSLQSPQLIQRLHELGADIELRSNKLGFTPLELACDHVQPKTIETLLQLGASIEGEKGRLALMNLAREDFQEAQRQYLEAMELLCQHGINLNRELSHNYRILDREISYARGPMIGLLLKSGARPALSWHTEQPAIRRWSGELWYGKLREICSDHEQPSSDDELRRTTISSSRSVENMFIMDPETQGVRYGICYPHPRPFLIPGISGSLDEEAFQRNRPYLQVDLPQNLVRVTSITIVTESHDQGYTDNDKHANGTYESSYSWFDLCFVYHKHPEHPIWQDVVQHNMNASLEWRTHTNTWSSEAPEDARAWARADAMWQLCPGDQIMLYPRAFFPGWANFVRRAEIVIEGLERKLA